MLSATLMQVLRAPAIAGRPAFAAPQLQTSALPSAWPAPASACQGAAPSVSHAARCAMLCLWLGWCRSTHAHPLCSTAPPCPLSRLPLHACSPPSPPPNPPPAPPAPPLDYLNRPDPVPWPLIFLGGFVVMCMISLVVVASKHKTILPRLEEVSRAGLARRILRPRSIYRFKASGRLWDRGW